MGAASAGTPALLIVTTVSASMGFHLPYANHFRRLGWRVEGAARGISHDARVSGAFDAVHELPFSRSILNLPAMAGGAVSLRRTLENGEYDLVHVHTPIAAFVTRAAIRTLPRHSRPRVVYTAHGFHFHQDGRWLTNRLFIAAERIAGRWTDRLIVINGEDLAAARRYRLVPASRLRHMHGIGVDTDWYSRTAVDDVASRDALSGIGMDVERPYFVSVGELNRNKRPTDIVRGLARMQDRKPALLFLGVGPERDPLIRLADELGLADRVVVPGAFVADVRPFVAPALALVQTSKREGLPRSIMEALSLEVPVITSAARGSRELVQSDRGEVVPIGAVEELAAAMDRICQQPLRRLEMGRRGRQLMVERYGLGPLIEEHEKLYHELLPGSTLASAGRRGDDD